MVTGCSGLEARGFGIWAFGLFRGSFSAYFARTSSHGRVGQVGVWQSWLEDDYIIVLGLRIEGLGLGAKVS